MSRPARLAAVLALMVLIMVLIGLTLGDYPLPFGHVLAALWGAGDADSVMAVREWRLPRAVMAPLAGAALGISGAIFQALTRNPLGSPDIIGFDAGAYCGGLVVILWGGGLLASAFGAIAGGIGAALLVYALASGKGPGGLRLILIGIGTGQLLFALGQWLLLQTDPETALAVGVWAAGNLSEVELPQLAVAATGFACLIPAALILTPCLRQLELGDDLARTTGLAVEPARRALILAGVALSALVTALVGPIAFVALVAPQLVAVLGRVPGTAPALAGLMGAVLLAGADLLAAHGFGARQLPVGIVTLCLGGSWFVWLLIRSRKAIT